MISIYKKKTQKANVVADLPGSRVEPTDTLAHNICSYRKQSFQRSFRTYERKFNAYC